MSDNCFTVKIEEPSKNILHIENSVGDTTKNIDIIQSGFYNLQVSPCMAMLPSDFETIVDAEISSFISAGSGINITSSLSGIIINASPITSGNFQFLSVNGVPVSLSGHKHIYNDILDFANGVSGLLPLISGSNYITTSFNNNIYTISTTGLQPSGNYSIVGHTHNIDNINGLQTALDNKQPSGIYASGIHYHISSDITNFNTSVSGLLPVKNITSGSGISVSNSGGDFTVSVTGQFGLTGEQVDDRVSSLLVAGNYINLNYNDNSDTLTINVSGVQPSGNYASSIHSHVVNDITDFNSSVSGLLPSFSGISGVSVSTSGNNYTIFLSDPTVQLADITDLSANTRTFLLTSSSDNLRTIISDETGSGVLVFNNSPAFSGIPTVPTAASGTNTSQIASTQFVRTEIANLVDSAPAALDTLNELAAALGDDANFSTTVTNSLAAKANLSGAIFSGSVTIPSGIGNFNTLTVNNTNVSVSGHTHISSDITNFNSSVSDLLPTISNSGDNRLLTSTGSNVGINAEANLTFDGSLLSVSGSGNFNGLSVSGINVSLIGHTHISSEITNFNSSVSGLLPVKNIIGGSGILVGSTSGDYTITAFGVAAASASSLVTEAYNSTGATIPKMSVVYINGGNGNLPTIQLGIANGEAGSSKTYAITAEEILHNRSGDVVVLGALIDVNTAQFGVTEGTLLYLSPTTSGGITATKPLAPNHMVSLGKIVRNHVNQGVIEVSIQNGFELYELHDVAVSGATAGQFLQRNGGGYWVPSSSGNFSTLQVNGTGVSLSGHSHNISDITNLQSSLDSKASLNSPTFSGIPTVPTATSGTNSSQIASTAFVRNEISNLVASARDRSTHTGTQTANTISDFTSAVVAAAPPTTNASLLTSGTLADARLSSNVILSNDSRLNDQRHPLSLSQGNTANYGASLPFPVGQNGGPSAYGTYDQSGGVWEWVTASGGIVRRGGSWGNALSNIDRLSSTIRVFYSSYDTITAITPFQGFRVVSPSNPSNYANFVSVGNTGNTADSSGYGSVAYSYQINRFKVTNADYVAFLNAVAATDTNAVYSSSMSSDASGGIIRSGSSGAYTYAVKTGFSLLPVNFVSWLSAARYCNWLHNGKPTGLQGTLTTEGGAYTLSGNNIVSPNVGAIYRMPTEDEWYKAAYYKGGTTNAGYWLYATQSNTAPDTSLAPVAKSGTYADLNGKPTTDGISEGTTNLYHTTARAAAAAPVQTVAGRTGAVTLSSSDITNFNTSVSGLLPTISNSGDNRVLTSTGTSTGINAENNLTFDGSLLTSPSGNFQDVSLQIIRPINDNIQTIKNQTKDIDYFISLSTTNNSTQTQTFTLPNNSIWQYNLKLNVLNQTDNNSAFFNIRGCIKNLNNSISIVGSQLSETWKDDGMENVVAILANNSGLQLQISGLSSKNLSWNGVLNIVQVGL